MKKTLTLITITLLLLTSCSSTDDKENTLANIVTTTTESQTSPLWSDIDDEQFEIIWNHTWENSISSRDRRVICDSYRVAGPSWVISELGDVNDQLTQHQEEFVEEFLQENC